MKLPKIIFGAILISAAISPKAYAGDLFDAVNHYEDLVRNYIPEKIMAGGEPTREEILIFEDLTAKFDKFPDQYRGFIGRFIKKHCEDPTNSARFLGVLEDRFNRSEKTFRDVLHYKADKKQIGLMLQARHYYSECRN